MRQGRFWSGAVVGVVATVAVAVGVAASGVISMQASQAPGLLDELGDMMFERSVQWRAPNESNPLADAPAAIDHGLRAYGKRCVGCHGAPGIEPMPAAAHMLPAPPDLAKSTRDMSDGEILFIIEHGVRMTGMPAFGPVLESSRELWQLVAAVRHLGTLDPEQKRMIAGKPGS